MPNHKPKITFKIFSNKKKNALQKRLNELHARIRAELAGKVLLDSAEVMHLGREERDKQLLENIK